MAWIVTEDIPYEGCSQHVGPFDTEEDAERFLSSLYKRHPRSFHGNTWELIDTAEYAQRQKVVLPEGEVPHG